MCRISSELYTKLQKKFFLRKRLFFPIAQALANFSDFLLLGLENPNPNGSYSVT